MYGLLILDNKILVTHEHRGDMEMTKFPGGGLEWGEGLADCLRREFREELDLKIEVGDLFYTNEFLQLSAFNPLHQLHSFYFRVHSVSSVPEHYFGTRADLLQRKQVFEWKEISSINPEDDFTFPIDRIVAAKIRSAQSL